MRTSRRKFKKRRIFIVSAVFVIATVFIIISIFKSDILYEIVTVEAGNNTLDTSQFIKDKKNSGTFITDLSMINMSAPGVYEIKIQVNKNEYSSKLEIKDTVAPVAELINYEIWPEEKKEAKEFVKNIIDATDVKVFFKNEPDYSKVGMQDVFIILEDANGNKTELKALLTIKVDTEPPKIEGAHDQTIYIGDTIAYKKDITVTDNRDNNVKLEVDSSAVNSKKLGTYNVIYKATDNSGNVATKTVTLKVIERPIVVITATKDDLDSLADTVLATIITNDMSKVQKAKAIYDWTRAHIRYVDHSDKADWSTAAIQGLNKGTGDCFVYFATAKELLTRAGIENQDIIKLGGGHYWSLVNCGDGWYHFDTTPRITGGVFFMLTDAQIEEYSKNNGGSHVWDKIKYPATPLK